MGVVESAALKATLAAVPPVLPALLRVLSNQDDDARFLLTAAAGRQCIVSLHHRFLHLYPRSLAFVVIWRYPVCPSSLRRVSRHLKSRQSQYLKRSAAVLLTNSLLRFSLSSRSRTWGLRCAARRVATVGPKRVAHQSTWRLCLLPEALERRTG